MTGDRFYSSPAWRQARLLVLARDGDVCQIRGDGCTLVATQVDHIVPLGLGGDALDPDNLRAACPTCNTARAHKKRRRRVPSREW